MLRFLVKTRVCCIMPVNVLSIVLIDCAWYFWMGIGKIIKHTCVLITRTHRAKVSISRTRGCLSKLRKVSTKLIPESVRLWLAKFLNHSLRSSNSGWLCIFLISHLTALISDLIVSASCSQSLALLSLSSCQLSETYSLCRLGMAVTFRKSLLWMGEEEVEG